MGPGAWNHNIHYHGVVLRSISSNCGRALDVGCGQGLLARQLAQNCREVVAIDLDRDTVKQAQAARGETGIIFVEGDVMTHPFPGESFDLITAVATLHHLPLGPALTRFRGLLRSGGILVVVGLYRANRFQDYALAAAAFPTSWILRRLRRFEEVGAPVQEPRETLPEIRAACEALLPGALFRRHLLFRYSFVWHKP